MQSFKGNMLMRNIIIGDKNSFDSSLGSMIFQKINASQKERIFLQNKASIIRLMKTLWSMITGVILLRC